MIFHSVNAPISLGFRWNEIIRNGLMHLSSSSKSKPTSWHNIVLFSIAFWLSSSLLVDFLIMPGLFVSGMMSQSDFGTVGYTLFWLFNRLEILCGALILTGLLVLRHRRQASDILVSGLRSRWSVELAAVLLAIALLYTYTLTPAMSALGMSLNWATAIPVSPAMGWLHGTYWALEAVKLMGGALLLRLCYGDLRALDQAEQL